MKTSLKNKKILFLIAVILLGFNYYSIVSKASSTDSPPPEYRVLILVSAGFGVTYFDAKDQFEAWDWIVDTAGTSPTVSSCPSQNPQLIQPEYLIDDVDWAIFSQYDCIFIPSGGHWDSLSTFEGTSRLIASAHGTGLVIASLCIGMVVLARAGILNGIRIARDSNAWIYLFDSGAIMTQHDVVTDNRIVTGGQGGGTSGGGASMAPTIELCEAIALEIQARRIGFIIGITSGVAASIVIVGLIIFLRKLNVR